MYRTTNLLLHIGNIARIVHCICKSAQGKGGILSNLSKYLAHLSIATTWHFIAEHCPVNHLDSCVFQYRREMLSADGERRPSIYNVDSVMDVVRNQSPFPCAQNGMKLSLGLCKRANWQAVWAMPVVDLNRTHRLIAIWSNVCMRMYIWCLDLLWLCKFVKVCRSQHMAVWMKYISCFTKESGNILYSSLVKGSVCCYKFYDHSIKHSIQNRYMFTFILARWKPWNYYILFNFSFQIIFYNSMSILFPYHPFNKLHISFSFIIKNEKLEWFSSSHEIKFWNK